MVAVLSVAVRQGLFLLEDRMVGDSEYCGATNQSLWIQGLANEVKLDDFGWVQAIRLAR